MFYCKSQIMFDFVQEGRAVIKKRAICDVHRKWSFPLGISSVNVAKSAVSCGCG